MPRYKPRESAMTSEAADEEPAEFDSFDEAYAHLMKSLAPGGWIDLHEETCMLVVDGPECTCTPHRITKGAQA